MKLLAILSGRFLNYGHVNLCRPLVIRINQSLALSYNANRSQAVDALLPKLSQWLDCSPAQAQEVYYQFPNRKYLDIEIVEDCVDFLKKNGVTSTVILDNPCLLLLPRVELAKRMRLLGRIGLEVDTTPLLRVASKHLAIVANQWRCDVEIFSKNGEKFHNRLQFFADNLQWTSYQVAMRMDRHYPLLTLDFERIARIMRLLLENGISRENIKNDLWIFRHNEALIHERIEITRNANVDPVKTWMLRCAESTLEITLDHLYKAKEVLGNHKDLESYLAERLNCSKEDIIALSRKHKPLPSTNIPKAKLILDFLFENGFTAEHVCSHIRVFCYSLSTMESRLRELVKLGYHPKRLSELYSTPRAYQNLTDKIKKKDHSGASNKEVVADHGE